MLTFNKDKAISRMASQGVIPNILWLRLAEEYNGLQALPSSIYNENYVPLWRIGGTKGTLYVIRDDCDESYPKEFIND